MTVLAGFAYTLVAYGVPVSLFTTTVARQPHEVIVMIVGAFFWLLSLFFSSVVWIIVPPLRYEPAFTLPFSVLFQEAFRWLFYKLIRKADKLLEIVSDDKTQIRKHKIAYVGGLGFGLISGIVSFANVVEAASGPGIVGITGQPGDSRYFVLASAFGALVMIILHTCWSVLWFDGWDNIRDWRGAVKVAVVVITHMVISCLSLANVRVTPLIFLPAAYLTAGILIVWSLFIAGLRPSSIKHFFTR